HAEIARECGVEEIVTVENGAVVELDEAGVRVAGRVPVGRIYRESGTRVPERVIRDRKLMAELGLAIVTVLVDDRGRPLGACDLLTRGVVYEDEHQALLDDACDAVLEALEDARWIVERPT